ncbi:hypothetical protein [Flavobacterium enshiense]|uniref:Uncharacterized protein n=1 Tax=Flavobacterium enshiense DK69 TaxID=1107311 RepID=A0A0A2MTM5_9FLAO|nr:hypothetical protein [Flavobacterium enshiense]KGO95674.1 hypothetical protein Q767_10680 [Flavobacterium enshiense DK69]
MLKGFLKIFIRENDYSVQNLPFLLNYEYYSLARGLEHYGYFIDSLGNVLHYNRPKNWNDFTTVNNDNSDVFWGYEIDGQITPNALFQNLNCIIRKSKSSTIINIDLVEILKILLMQDLKKLSEAVIWGFILLLF